MGGTVVVVVVGGTVVVVVVVVVGGGAPSRWNVPSERSASRPITSTRKSPLNRSSGGVHTYDPIPASIPSATVVLSANRASWAQYRDPWSHPQWSVISMCQVPAMAWSAREDSGSYGRCRPAKGATPVSMLSAASSAKTVRVPLQSSAPLPKSFRQLPLWKASRTESPSGATRRISRSAV